MSLVGARRVGAASKSFVERFKKQRTRIAPAPSKDRKNSTSLTGSLRDKRDEVHQNAFSVRPVHWRRTNKADLFVPFCLRQFIE